MPTRFLTTSRRTERQLATLRPLPSPLTGLPRLPEPPFRRAVPTTPADRAGARVDCFPTHVAFPKWQEGRHPHCHFEACSGFTHVTACRIAQPPKAAFVTRLQPCRLPDRAARQLPDQSTTLWVESSATKKVIRAFGAHCQTRTSALAAIRAISATWQAASLASVRDQPERPRGLREKTRSACSGYS